MPASPKSIFQKLGLKSFQNAIILHLPKGLDLGTLPAGSKIQSTLAGPHELILGFYESTRELKADLPKLKKALTKTGAAWVSYRKGGATELSRDSIWSLVGDFGLEGVGMISIDDDWSGFKIMHPKAERE